MLQGLALKAHRVRIEREALCHFRAVCRAQLCRHVMAQPCRFVDYSSADCEATSFVLTVLMIYCIAISLSKMLV